MGHLTGSPSYNQFQIGHNKLTPNLLAFFFGQKPSLTAFSNKGSSTPTFTRASTAYQTDFEGKLNLVPSGAARMQGARYVQNIIATSSEDATTAGSWAKYISSATPTVTLDTVDFPVGTTKSTQIVTTDIYAGVKQIAVITVGKVYTVSWWAKATIAGKQMVLSDSTADLATITLTTNWIRYSKTFTATQTLLAWLDKEATGCTFKISGIVVQDVTGQTNQNPSEYVSVGVLSAPYHGAGVDGVQYFSTLNGNTVASNVVTEATGAAINSSAAAAAGGVTAKVVDASGPLGYLSEGSRQNLALQSQDFSTTWGVNPAGTLTVSTDAIASPDGGLTADKLVEAAVTNTHRIAQAITVANNSVNTFSIFLKDGGRSTATIFDNNTIASVAIDLGAGTITPANSTATIKAYPNGWYSISFTWTSVGTSAAVFVQVGTTSYAGDITKGIYAWQAQLEAASFASSPIPTTTVAVTRAASVDQYVSASNVPTNDFTVYGEVSWPIIPPAASYFLWASYVDANNYTAILWDGTNLIGRKRIGGVNHDATIAFAPVAGTRYKFAGRFTSTTGTDIFLTGAVGTNDATNTACQIGANFQIGADGNGANQPFAEIPTLRIMSASLSNQDIITLTT